VLQLTVTASAVLLFGILAGCAEPPACRIAAGAEDARVGNGACLVVERDSLLLVRQRPSGRWGLPGGRRARGETGQCTAHRETWEETGHAVIVGLLRFRTRATLVYQCELTSGALPAPAGERPWLSRIEISEQRWVPAAEIDTLPWRFPDHLAAIDALIESDALATP
jgi:8-oxo-dGTP pyrophosphatase MutT (NUDIX family)